MVRPDRNEEPVTEERDLQLENLIGNYYVSQFQTDRLLQHIVTKTGGSKVDAKTNLPKMKTSHTIKYNGKWYRITTIVKELTIDELLRKD